MTKLPRFYVPSENVKGEKILLSSDVIQHAVKTLRLKSGDKLVLFDGSGAEYEGVLRRENANCYSADIQKTNTGLRETSPKLFLFQAPIKKEPWEWLLEKATELGVHAIIPLLTRFVEVDVIQNFAKKRERWKSIVVSACEQSERTTLPDLLEPTKLEDAIRNCPKPALFFYEGSGEESLRSVLSRLPNASQISLFIGPVGGFAKEEADRVRATGIPLVSLGERVLRAETAAIASLSILNYQLGTRT